ncbi:B12-binding domain-containing radical SAM protein [Altericista sp. CCNU0014]|uniref:B12-binding domain-containing radical SAM protein n=1 Tax=Altericista sp. CCNU0014 TaxID=3082949 RepID=UPI00384D2004
MKALLLYPLFPQSFWSYDRYLEMAGLKALLPPLGIITVAAMLPDDWDIRFADRNVGVETEADWEWCELVIVSAMMAQRSDFLSLIRKGVALGKKVAVGGPYPTSVPQDALDAGAQYLVLDEGELTIPMFLSAIARGDQKGVFRSAEKPDVTLTPMPRFELLKQKAYLTMSIQFSRGCPFNCEFCDIITLYGRKPRTKTPTQALGELQRLYDLGWRGPLFIVDDNFIGNQRNVKLFLRELIPWMEERNYPFVLITEASINLADDPELLDLMRLSGFFAVFLGIETPDEDSLKGTRKLQNTRSPMIEACRKINEAGLFIYAGFIIGFDGERKGAGDRIQAFVDATSIHQPMLGILQAPPNTALWDRLEREERLEYINFDDRHSGDQNSLMNFLPTRPKPEIAKEYVESMWTMYEPRNYLKRCMDQCLNVADPPFKRQWSNFTLQQELLLFARVAWYQGIRRSGARIQFWRQLFTVLIRKPKLFDYYVSMCAEGEHFFDYRILAKERIGEQVKALSLNPNKPDFYVPAPVPVPQKSAV